MVVLHLTLLVGAFALIAVYEIPNMVKEHEWRELTAFSVLLLFALALGILLYADVNIPNPIDWIEAAIRRLTHITGALLD